MAVGWLAVLLPRRAAAALAEFRRRPFDRPRPPRPSRRPHELTRLVGDAPVAMASVSSLSSISAVPGRARRAATVPADGHVTEADVEASAVIKPNPKVVTLPPAARPAPPSSPPAAGAVRRSAVLPPKVTGRWDGGFVHDNAGYDEQELPVRVYAVMSGKLDALCEKVCHFYESLARC